MNKEIKREKYINKTKYYTSGLHVVFPQTVNILFIL